jgi:uncharacterized OsmC-like protein
MDADSLRSLQAPIKQAYKDDPSKARVVMLAEGEIACDEVACKVVTALGPVVAGLHPAAGGDGSQACSGDMLLQALVACSGVTFSAVAMAMGIDVGAASIRAQAVMDFRGTLGVDRSVPIGITELELNFEIRSSADDEKLSKLVELTERYCVVLQTLAQPARLNSSWQRS